MPEKKNRNFFRKVTRNAFAEEKGKRQQLEQGKADPKKCADAGICSEIRKL